METPPQQVDFKAKRLYRWTRFTISKLGGASTTHAASMKATDFGPRSPGKLVPTIEGALAFVPDPIPRRLPLSMQTINLVAAAENGIGRLCGITARLYNPYLVGSPLLHREAIFSSRIEGTITTPERLVLLESGGDHDALPGRAADAETREVLNYVAAMQCGLKLLETLPICLRLIREIHAALMRGVRGERERPGEFRNTQNWIGRRGDSIHDARFVPPPVPEMMESLGDFEKHLNSEQVAHPSPDDLPLLVRLALAHYQFEAIHPFRDGNGRIGRLLIPLLLISHRRVAAPLLYLSSFFDRNRDAYMDLLLHVSREGDWGRWIDFFLTGIAECSEEAIAQAEGLERLREGYHEKFRAKRTSGLLPKLIDRLFSQPSITIPAASKFLNVSHTAATYTIAKLQRAGILEEVTHRKKNHIFVAREILAFMYDSQQPARPEAPSYVTQSPQPS